MTLAFILGIFRRLGEIISQTSTTSPVDVAHELRPESDSRTMFLRSAIKYANEFLSLNRQVFQGWEIELQAKIEAEEQSVLTNGMLARALAPLVSREICNFFNILEGLKKFERGAVNTTIHTGILTCRPRHTSRPAIIQSWAALSWF